MSPLTLSPSITSNANPRILAHRRRNHHPMKSALLPNTAPLTPPTLRVLTNRIRTHAHTLRASPLAALSALDESRRLLTIRIDAGDLVQLGPRLLQPLRVVFVVLQSAHAGLVRAAGAFADGAGFAGAGRAAQVAVFPAAAGRWVAWEAVG